MRLTSRMTIAAALLAVVGCTTTPARVSTNYYTVSGLSASEIDRDIRRKGPMKGHALAVAAIELVPVSVLQQQSDKGCKFITARFRVDAQITLPRWKDKNASKDRDLKRAWHNLATYARAHENMHVTIAQRYATRLSEEILAIPAQRDCKTADKRAERVVKSVGKAHHAAQEKFDRDEQRRLRRLIAIAEARNAG